MNTFDLDDNFDNDKEVKEWRRNEAEFQKMVDDSIRILAEPFNAIELSHKNLKNFLLHKSIALPFVSTSYEGNLNNKSIYFCIFSYETSVRAGRVRNSGSDFYFAGVINLDKSYPHTIIQPETLALKIVDFVTKSDIDFKEDKKFSRRFHLVSKDQERLKMLLLNKNLNKLTKHSSAEIEINGNQCYFRENRKPVSLKEAERFLGLTKILLEIL